MTASAAARSILRDPTFARLWFIQAATQVGGNMALYALTVLVFDTTRSNTAVGALVASFVLPQIILSPFAGVVVDRLDLRWALIGPERRPRAPDGGARPRRRERAGAARAEPRDQPHERGADPGRGVDDPAGRAARPAPDARWASST